MKTRAHAVLWAPALQLIVTLPLAMLLNVWQDDAYTLHTTAHGLAYAWHEALAFEQNAPLYFALLSIWRHADASAQFARLFSVFCAAGAVALVPALCRRYLPCVPAGWPSIAIALNPFLIWAALEIRVYAMVVLLAALLLLFFSDAFLAERPRRFAPAFYAAAGIAAAYTQYYLLFLIAAQGLALAAYRRDRLPNFAAAGGAVAIAFAPLLRIVPQQMSSFRSVFLPPTLLQSVRVPAEILAIYLLPLNRTVHSHAAQAAIAAALAIAGFVLLRGRIRLRAGSALPAVIFAIAFAIFATALYATREHALTRHASWLFMPLVLFFFSLFAFVTGRVRERAMAACVAIMLLVYAGALFNTYRALAKPGDWRRVSAYIERRERPGEPIVVFQAENAVPFEYYYRGSNAVRALPRAPDFRSYNVAEFAVRNSADVARAFSGAGEAWFVQAGDCRALTLDFGCAIVARYIGAHFTVASERHFYESTVRLLVRRPLASALRKRPNIR